MFLKPSSSHRMLKGLNACPTERHEDSGMWMYDSDLCTCLSGVSRVMGVLAVARAIGDAQLKPYVTAEPDVKIVPRADEQW